MLLAVAVGLEVHPAQDVQQVDVRGEQVLGGRPDLAAGPGPGEDAVGREVFDEYLEAPPAQRAFVDFRELDAIRGLEVGFEGVAVLIDEIDELEDSPRLAPTSSW